MQILGFNKTTLLDYPGHLASTIFLSGCNFRCPFCHNRQLVFPAITKDMNALEYTVDEIIAYVDKRKNILEGICITGGEPTLANDLKGLITLLKSRGLLVKLDTNGTNPILLKELLENNLLDYVAMDVKNSKENYWISTGFSYYNTHLIEKSISILKNCDIPYEFRTTLVLEHHTEEDIHALGTWLKGDSFYYLQNFRPSEHTIEKGLHPLPDKLLKRYCHELEVYLPNVKIRGSD